MPSPFPGMDPYLEDPAFWPDFHHRFVDCWCEGLADVLPDAYEARINERVHLVQMSPEVIKLIYPDVAVSRAPNITRRKRKASTLLLEPVIIPHEFLEEVRQSRIEILHRADRSLVAVLELLSPTNKTGDGFHEYRAKRKLVRRQNVHLVELDLLLAGNRLPLLHSLPEGDYFAFVSRSDDRLNCAVRSWSIRQPLPAIPIPLRSPDEDVPSDLGGVFKTTYERGRYARSLPYGKAPAAPLSEEDKLWAARQKPKF